jgi:hypothetical protein
MLERGLGFDNAAAIFIGPTLEALDNRRTTARSEFRRLAVLVTTFYTSSTRIETRFAASYRRDSPTKRKSFIERWSKSAE